MINARQFFESLSSGGIDFYTGVPDSLLAGLCACIDELTDAKSHVIAANEGNAVGIALGYHLATNKVAAVYMQNSGLGNAVNPLASLADPEVYKVPMLLLIGWRGEPTVKDEPQHVKQGRITLAQLETLEIPYWIVDADCDISGILEAVFDSISSNGSPAALVFRQNTFLDYPKQYSKNEGWLLSREQALEQIFTLCKSDDLVISTTGKTSREVYELRAKLGQGHRDFLTVGGMGHTSSIALGVALGRSDRRVICIDGDGSLIMHMGALAVIGKCHPQNFIHVLLNNESHESVGGQPTAADCVDFVAMAQSTGYSGYRCATDASSLDESWKALDGLRGPVLLEIKIKNGSRGNLGRPSSSPQDNKHRFMDSLYGR